MQAITGMRTKKGIIKSMKYKRGADLRIKFKHLKDKFINDLSELESEIVQSYENAPKDDNFNINELYIAIREVDAIKQTICNFNAKKEKKVVACSTPHSNGPVRLSHRMV